MESSRHFNQHLLEIKRIQNFKTLCNKCKTFFQIGISTQMCWYLRQRVKSLGERESSGFSRHHILLPPQIGQLDLPRFYFTIRQINWIHVKSRQQTHEASNFGFNFWPCNHSVELAKQSNFLKSQSQRVHLNFEKRQNPSPKNLNE